jgi:hypothetical protein
VCGVKNKNEFLENLKGKRVRIVQMDRFVKDGILKNYDDEFLYIVFSSGRITAIRRENIIALEVLE